MDTVISVPIQGIVFIAIIIVSLLAGFISLVIQRDRQSNKPRKLCRLRQKERQALLNGNWKQLPLPSSAILDEIKVFDTRPRIVAYSVARGSDTIALAGAVSASLKEGWQPFGDIVKTQAPSGWAYLQVLVKYEQSVGVECARWISVNERLPERGTLVIVQPAGPYYADVAFLTTSGVWCKSNGIALDLPVRLWMPLPEGSAV